MFNIGFSELVVLGVLALLFLKPEELPAIARSIARFLNEIKRSTDSLKEEFKGASVVDDLQNIKNDLTQVGHNLKESITENIQPQEVKKLMQEASPQQLELQVQETLKDTTNTDNDSKLSEKKS